MLQIQRAVPMLNENMFSVAIALRYSLLVKLPIISIHVRLWAKLSREAYSEKLDLVKDTTVDHV